MNSMATTLSPMHTAGSMATRKASPAFCWWARSSSFGDLKPSRTPQDAPPVLPVPGEERGTKAEAAEDWAAD